MLQFIIERLAMTRYDIKRASHTSILNIKVKVIHSKHYFLKIMNLVIYFGELRQKIKKNYLIIQLSFLTFQRVHVMKN